MILQISCQGQLGQWQGMEQKASQGTACDPGPYVAYRTEHTHTQIETLGLFAPIHTRTLPKHGVNCFN